MKFMQISFQNRGEQSEVPPDPNWATRQRPFFAGDQVYQGGALTT